VLPQGPDGVPRAVVGVVAPEAGLGADPAVPTVPTADEVPGGVGSASPGALARLLEHETPSDATLTQATTTRAVRSGA
jgi:hypothetical protein